MNATRSQLTKQFNSVKSYLPDIQAAGEPYGFPASLLLAIGSRETNFNPRYKSSPGDRGNGFSWWQIDKRSFPDFTSSEDWKDPKLAVKKSALVLFEKRTELQRLDKELIGNDLLRCSVAAYNCGSGPAYRNFKKYGDPDRGTTGKDYSADVLAREEVFADLLFTELLNASPEKAPLEHPKPEGSVTVDLPTEMPGGVTVQATSSEPGQITTQDVQGVVTGHADSAKSIIFRLFLKVGAFFATIWETGIAGKAFLIVGGIVAVLLIAYELNKYWPKFKPWAVGVFKGFAK